MNIRETLCCRERAFPLPGEAEAPAGNSSAPSGTGLPRDSYLPDSTGPGIPLAPGLTYREGVFRGAPFHLVQVMRREAPVNVRPCLAAGDKGQVVSAMHGRTGSIATMNGTFFNTAGPGKTMYGEIKTDEGEYRPSMVKMRTYWAVTPGGTFEMGETTPGDPMADGRVSYAIPMEKWNSFRYVLGGGGRLILDGCKASEGAGINDEHFLPDVLARRNRSALGYASQGASFWMVSCDPPGWTPQETADFFLGLGADQAMFLDGGGSTEMMVKDRIVTTLSAGSERAMPTALVIIPGQRGDETRGQTPMLTIPAH